ncbi:MAG TPA: hypothetical protein VNA31_07010 [bacterium]|nr:hypothetical protein [bacterium]
MHLTIRDVAAKPKWLAKMSAFLHDAVFFDPPVYNTANRTLGIAIARIGYEFAVRQQEGFLSTWRMPRVAAVLAVSPVSVVRGYEGVPPQDRGDQLLEIGMAAPTELQVTTDQCTISLFCEGRTTLYLADTSPPSDNLTVTDAGALIVRLDVIAEIINSTVV